MKNLTLEQIKSIPWNSKYLKESEYPPEPAPEEVAGLLKVPYIKRDSRLVLFYCWNEIIELVTESECSVLDAACGRGQISRVLRDYGHRVNACDIEDNFCAGGDISFTKADLNLRFPYGDEQFDYVLNSTALHYLNDTRHYLEECGRVLKKGGYVIFSIPNIESFSNRIYFLRNGKIPEYSSAVLSRKNFIYPDYLFALMEDTGFSVTDINGTVPVLSARIKLANFIFGRKFFGNKNDYIKYSPILVIKARYGL